MLTVYAGQYYYPILEHFKHGSDFSFIADSRSFRATIRLFKQELNMDRNTAKIYSLILPPNLSYRATTGEFYIADYFSTEFAGKIRERINQEMIDDFVFNCTDLNFPPGYLPTICDPGQQFNYTGLDEFQ
jgi:hypothetical protein